MARLHAAPPSFDLGLVGLTLFLPAAVLVLVTGLFADRHDRRTIVAVAFLGLVVAHVDRVRRPALR
jgi:MFS family permease